MTSSTGRASAGRASGGPASGAGPASGGAGDLTARARIRNAALRHFTEHGFDRTTVRDVARAAGVSPGLIRHHFGSKDGLRQACDRYALDELRAYAGQAVTDQGLDLEVIASAREPLHPYQQYLARALIDQSAAAAAIFDEMVALTGQLLRRLDQGRPDPPVADLTARAAVSVAMALGVPAFRAHISRSIGADVASPEGDRRVSLAVLDIQSRPVITPETARALSRDWAAPPGSAPAS